jgi:hypothetical protein
MSARYLYGQHADGIPVTAIRLLAVLSQERCAAADYHGYDLPRRGQFHGAAVDRRRALHHVSADCLVAAEYSVRRPLRDRHEIAVGQTTCIAQKTAYVPRCLAVKLHRCPA